MARLKFEELHKDNVLTSIPKHSPKTWLRENIFSCTLYKEFWGLSNGCSALTCTQEQAEEIKAKINSKKTYFSDKQMPVDPFFEDSKDLNADLIPFNLYKWSDIQVLILRIKDIPQYTFLNYQMFSFFRNQFKGKLTFGIKTNYDGTCNDKPIFIFENDNWVGCIMPLHSEVTADVGGSLPRNRSLLGLQAPRNTVVKKKGQAICPCCNHIFDL
jgi:hypothetical protein